MPRCVAGTKVIVQFVNYFPRHKSITVEGVHMKANILSLISANSPVMSVLFHFINIVSLAP